MNSGRIRARELVSELGLRGRVDPEDVASRLGIQIDMEDFMGRKVQEITIGNRMAVRADMGERMRRWVIAHGIGHWLLHNEGNHARLSIEEPRRYWDGLEREAEAFAHELMVGAEHFRMGDRHEIAAHYGVPAHKAMPSPLGGFG